VTTNPLRWIDPEHPDLRDLSGAVAVLEAARQNDAPHQPPMTTARLHAGITHGWDGTPVPTAVLPDADGRVVGVLEVSLPMWDNRHIGQLDITVDPAARRRGFGRALFEAGVAQVREAGRTTIIAEGWDQPGFVAFAKAVGLERGSDEINRHQDLRGLDRAYVAEVLAEAAKHADDYELVRVPGAVPDDLVETVVELAHAINDAPTDDLDLEDEVFSAERLRAFEDSSVRLGRRPYQVVARHRETGAPAGHTVVAVDEQFPWFGYQYDTSVVRAHRGHRLGLLLKADMLDWLREQEPQLTVLSTWNAATNDHMIDVNERLGYRVVANAVAWQIRI
jgi:GNAT superfamily N-acetyltransferase